MQHLKYARLWLENSIFLGWTLSIKLLDRAKSKNRSALPLMFQQVATRWMVTDYFVQQLNMENRPSFGLLPRPSADVP